METETEWIGSQDKSSKCLKTGYLSNSLIPTSKLGKNRLTVTELYVWLGSDTIFSIDFFDNFLNCDIGHRSIRIPSIRGTECNLGGFFLSDNKLHYLGGAGPKKLNFNKKVFSFKSSSSFKPDESTYFPHHSGCKLRPIVFTLSNKVYALSTFFPVSETEPIPFEVYEPEFGKWRSLPAPPIAALYTLRNHCVFRNKLLLQSFYGDFIFDANAETKGWERTQLYPKCCAVLEFEDFDIILVLTREPFELVAYELKSFGEINCWSQVVEIEENDFDFSELDIVWASLNYIGDSRVCLVFISSRHNLHISSFKLGKTKGDRDIFVHILYYEVYDIPIRRYVEFHNCLTFLWFGKVRNPTVSVDDVTKAVSNCERPESDWTESQDISSNCLETEDSSISFITTSKEGMEFNGSKVRKLYVLLGFDTYLSLDLDVAMLCRNPYDIIFSLPSIPSTNRGIEYNFGGFFLKDSKLHYLGGAAKKFNFFNKNVFSFNLPSFKPDDSTYFPHHSGCKLKPIVFTLSNKVYALSTFFPVSETEPLPFEVYEPEFGKWRSLPAPPIAALYTLRNHCVFRNKLLLQSFYGDFIFDTNAEKWERTQVYPKCCAVLEYNDLLLVLTREPFKLVAYELKSFGEVNCSSQVVEIEQNYFDFSELDILWASLNYVGNNCICLVFISSRHNFHVSLFNLFKTNNDDINGHVKAYHKFDIPVKGYLEFHHYSTFYWCGESGDRRRRMPNQWIPERFQHDYTKAVSVSHVDPRRRRLPDVMNFTN